MFSPSNLSRASASRALVAVAAGLGLFAVIGCSDPISAPQIRSREIGVRNEIDRVWVAFRDDLVAGRTAEAWERLSTRLRRTRFGNDPARFAGWVEAERRGLLEGLEGAWLYQLSLRGWTATARPEDMPRLRNVRFLLESGRWRMDGWTPIPEP